MSKKTVKIDEELHKQLKIRAAHEGRQLEDLIEEILQKALGLVKEVRE
jgi:plasmid stability protein